MKLSLLRKLINKKNLLFIFVIIFLTFAPVIVSQAMDQSFVSPTAANVAVISQNGSATIINRSDKNYFVPNKTSPEWNSFQQNTPKYVSIAVCGDGTCSEGEDSTICPDDCPVATGYCGDGICSNTQVWTTYDVPKVVDRYEKVCVRKRTGWLWVPIVNIVLLATGNDKYTKCDYVNNKVTITQGWEPAGEVYAITNTSIKQQVCKDDCLPPAGSGCGSCGYDSSGNLCPNYCSNRGYNMINCSYHTSSVTNSSGCTVQQQMVLNSNPIKKYFTASEALANAAAVACQSSSFTTSGGYGCNYGGDTSALCPAGQYCPDTGGLKPGTSLTSWNPYATAPSCSAGYFCPLGSIFQRICPVNTYSTGGATACTACPSGTISMPGANNIDMCAPFFKANDGICNTASDGNGETPANSPYDCPDDNSLAKWKNDGRCTGIENSTNSPNDCHCGNGTCDDGETALSCLADCACMDSTCGTRKYIGSGNYTVYNEGNTCNSYGRQVTNPSDCKYMNAGEVCGNGVCEAGEKYNSSIGRIVCPLDCHCGDGYCGTGETMANCSLDCFCGDGTCNHGEYSATCMQDCHCGDGQCQDAYNENAANCKTDCRCGDHICSYGEDYSSCSADCPLQVGTCGDGVCGYTDLGNGKTRKETPTNCDADCGAGQLQ